MDRMSIPKFRVLLMEMSFFNSLFCLYYLPCRFLCSLTFSLIIFYLFLAKNLVKYYFEQKFVCLCHQLISLFRFSVILCLEMDRFSICCLETFRILTLDSNLFYHSVTEQSTYDD